MDWQDILYAPVEIDTATDEQISACIREWRNRQLAASDWTQLSDTPADKPAWAAYRQELRDMMQQNSNPKLIVFPTAPVVATVEI